MLRWKKESDGRTALLIKGARRIGKSTIAEEFARKEYETYIIIDFSIARRGCKRTFYPYLGLKLFLSAASVPIQCIVA